MFDTLKRVFSDLTSDTPTAAWAFDDPRLAVAVLMVDLIAVDGKVAPSETTRMTGELAHRYGLDPREIATLIEAARACDHETTGLQSFAAGLARRLPMAERHELVESLFRIALADGSLHEFEDNFVWRIAELLGVAPRDRVAIRKRLEADGDRDPSSPRR